jgi:outer membrane lipoprotein-sorting protein
MARTDIRLATLVLAVAVLVAVTPLAAQNDTAWTVKSALKEMDKALKGLSGLKAEIHWDELVCKQRVVGSGTIHVNLFGQVRADVGGTNPRTIVVSPPFFYVYKPQDEIAQRYYLPNRPDLMGQYALVGFNPAGSDLKKDYKVTLLRTEELDGRDTIVFNLAPKDKTVEATIAAIVLWVDQSTWMPYQQVVRHAGGLQATIRYTDMAPTEDLSEELFRNVWPPDTRIVAQ